MQIPTNVFTQEVSELFCYVLKINGIYPFSIFFEDFSIYNIKNVLLLLKLSGMAYVS